MKFEEFFIDAKKEIIILGTNTLIPHLENSINYFVNKMTLENDLEFSIYYESNSENFNQSLTTDTKNSINRISFTALQTHKHRIVGTTNSTGLKNEILDKVDEVNKVGIEKRLILNQVNLRLPTNIIKVDDNIWYCSVTHKLPTINDYLLAKGKQKDNFLDYLNHYINTEQGKIFLTKRGDELIQIYDKDSVPRGIIPRKAFYSTHYKRYSIWGFIFNRKGELLLHQRSKTTKDNRLLWDKSTGGHVDIADSSTYQTAQRELIEELFLPEAEYTRYLKEDIGDIINYGDLNFEKRPEREFKEAFKRLRPTDWIMFRATDQRGSPLTINRVSERILHDKNDNTTTKKTIFMSDIYIFIAPENHIDTQEQMKELVKLSEKTGAAENHKIISLDDLREWIEESEARNDAKNIFTDDLLYINLEMRPLLERFSEFTKFVF